MKRKWISTLKKRNITKKKSTKRNKNSFMGKGGPLITNDEALTLYLIKNRCMEVDKQIKKVRKDIEKKDKKTGLIDVRKLLKMDKKFDKKIEESKKIKKKCM